MVRPAVRSAWESEVTNIPLHFRRAPGPDEDKEEEDLECVDLFEWIPNRVPCGGGKLEEMPSYLFQPLVKRKKKISEKKVSGIHVVSIDLEDIPCLEDTEKKIETQSHVPPIGIFQQEQQLQHFMTLESSRTPGKKVWERWQVFEVFGNMPNRMSQNWVSGSNWKSILEQMKQNTTSPNQQLSTFSAINKKMLTSWRAQQECNWNSSDPFGRSRMIGHEYEMAVIGAYNYHGGWRALDNIKIL